MLDMVDMGATTVASSARKTAGPYREGTNVLQHKVMQNDADGHADADGIAWSHTRTHDATSINTQDVLSPRRTAHIQDSGFKSRPRSRQRCLAPA